MRKRLRCFTTVAHRSFSTFTSRYHSFVLRRDIHSASKQAAGSKANELQSVVVDGLKALDNKRRTRASQILTAVRRLHQQKLAAGVFCTAPYS